MNIEELEQRVRDCLETEPNKDPVFRMAILLSEVGDIAKYMTHDQKINPLARSHGSKEDEKLAYGQAFVQFFACMVLRGIDPEEAINLGLLHWEDKDWAKKSPQRNKEGDIEETVIIGIASSPGVIEGKAFVLSPFDKAKIPEARAKILVTDYLRPDYAIAAIEAKVKAIVTNQGGSVSHGATIARQHGMPCVSGTANATERIHQGDYISVDGKAGEIVILE
ncbi:MAG: PEP-utilizing enzyme [Patescibacteria group bacterium]|nr:PEP-utilizing enzyme [Patescibacteria group bacterium]